MAKVYSPLLTFLHFCVLWLSPNKLLSFSFPSVVTGESVPLMAYYDPCDAEYRLSLPLLRPPGVSLYVVQVHIITTCASRNVFIVCVLHQQTHSANDVNLFVALLFDLLEDVSTYLGMSAIIAIQTSN